jgi:hypothetical protein
MLNLHWLTLIGLILVGYVIARYFPQPGQAIGLP